MGELASFLMRNAGHYFLLVQSWYCCTKSWSHHHSSTRKGCHHVLMLLFIDSILVGSFHCKLQHILTVLRPPATFFLFLYNQTIFQKCEFGTYQIWYGEMGWIYGMKSLKVLQNSQMPQKPIFEKMHGLNDGHTGSWIHHSWIHHNIKIKFPGRGASDSELFISILAVIMQTWVLQFTNMQFLPVQG